MEANCRIGRVIRKGRDNVVTAPMETRLDYAPSEVLALSAQNSFDAVVVIGYGEDGEYFASSTADGPEVLWLLERCKRTLLMAG